jgi:hypothetical protein
MNRLILFGSKITLHYKPLRGMGVREIVLLTLAAGQAVYLVFLAESMSFPLRLTLALFLAILLLAAATIPVRGYKVEQFLIGVLLRGLIRPRRYLHQTATRNEPSLADVGDEADEAGKAAPQAVVAPVARELDWGAWAGPNLALVMTMFVLILLIGGLMAYASKGGRLPF